MFFFCFFLFFFLKKKPKKQYSETLALLTPFPRPLENWFFLFFLVLLRKKQKIQYSETLALLTPFPRPLENCFFLVFFVFFEAFLVFAFCCYRRLCLRCIRQSCCQSLCTKCCGEAISASIHFQPSTFEDMAPQIARPMAAAKPKKVQDVEVASSGGDLVFEDDFWECLGESILGLTSLT